MWSYGEIPFFVRFACCFVCVCSCPSLFFPARTNSHTHTHDDSLTNNMILLFQIRSLPLQTDNPLTKIAIVAKSAWPCLWTPAYTHRYKQNIAAPFCPCPPLSPFKKHQHYLSVMRNSPPLICTHTHTQATSNIDSGHTGQ